MKILIDLCCICKKHTTQLAGFKYTEFDPRGYGYLCLNCGLREWDYYHTINKKPGKKNRENAWQVYFKDI